MSPPALAISSAPSSASRSCSGSRGSCTSGRFSCACDFSKHGVCVRHGAAHRVAAFGLDRANELGMVVILGIFYFGQDERVADEAAVIRAVDATIDWLQARGDRHVLIEINNECNVPKYDHAILKPDRVHELIMRVRDRV